MAELDYSAFGEALIRQAVTAERVVAAVRQVAGNEVELGPLKAGPGGKATVNAIGTLGEPTAEKVGDVPLEYKVSIPVKVKLEVRVGATHRYDASGRVDLHLVVRAFEPLEIIIDLEPAKPSDVHFKVDGKGVQAKLLGRAGDVEGELRRHTAEYVNERVSSSDAARFLHIDVLPVIDRVWAEI